MDGGIHTGANVDRIEVSAMEVVHHGTHDFYLDLKSTFGTSAREGEELNVLCFNGGRTEETIPWSSAREGPGGSLS